MWEPTRLRNGEGRRREGLCLLTKSGEDWTTKPSWSHRGSGDGMLTEEINATREAWLVTACDRQRDSREGQARPDSGDGEVRSSDEAG